MAFTPTEEALVRQLLGQQAAILSLANNEPTITSKLGSTKVTLSDLASASVLADADLMLTRQGANDKSVSSAILANYVAGKLNLSSFAPKADPTFTGNPTAPTPAQFDNDTSLATSAFVQRALGNHSDWEQLNSPVIMDASHAGKFITLNNAGAVLPDPATVPKGTKFTIKSVGSVYVQIYCVIGQMLFYGLSTSASVSLYPGDTLELVSDGGSNWYASGSGATKYTSQWGANLAGNGYQKLPSGLIIQWGEITTSGSGGVTLTYPIAFPVGVLSGHMELKSTPGVAALHTGMDFSGASTTSMTVYSRDAITNNYSAGTLKYFLIGH